MTNDTDLAKLVNRSGFLFQVAVEEHVRAASARHEWQVLAPEYPWRASDGSRSGFIDFVLGREVLRAVVECKRTQGGEWVFLVPEPATETPRLRTLWAYRPGERAGAIGWGDFLVDPVGFTSGFCSIRGASDDDKPMLERISSELVRASESLAREELTMARRHVARCVTASRVRYHFASRATPLKRRSVRRPEGYVTSEFDEAAAGWEQLNTLEQNLLMDLMVDDLSSRERPDVTLYHYAPPLAFDSIVRERSMWFTNAAYMNDKGELGFPVALAREVIKEYLGRTADPGLRRFLMSVAVSIDSHEQLRQWYIASFSTNGDLLSQWRAYCPVGGYSLGLSAGKLFDSMPERIRVRMGPVIYESDAQIARIKRILDRQLENWSTKRAENSELPQERFDRAVGTAIMFALTYEFIFFKWADFAEEREWRLVQAISPSDDLRFRERQGVLTPYIHRPLASPDGLLPIERIHVSPLVEVELAREAAILLLARRNYSDPISLVKAPAYRLRF